MGDFNINLNCNTDKDTSDYIDTFYSHSFYPTVNSPTRIAPNAFTVLKIHLGFAEVNSVFIVITSAKILPR